MQGQITTAYRCTVDSDQWVLRTSFATTIRLMIKTSVFQYSKIYKNIEWPLIMIVFILARFLDKRALRVIYLMVAFCLFLRNYFTKEKAHLSLHMEWPMQEKASQWLEVKKNRVCFLTLLNGFFSLKTILI